MKLMMFKKGTGSALGVVDGTSVIDVSSVGTLQDVIAGGPSALAAVKAAAAKGAKQPLSAVKAALPIARPGKFLCIGLNYALHAAEGGHATPTYPALFPASPPRSSPLANRSSAPRSRSSSTMSAS